MTSLLNEIASALYSACIKDLNDIHYLSNKYVKNKDKNVLKNYDVIESPMTRRPDPNDIKRVDVFQQGFGHGGGLFGGMGTACMCEYNIIVVFGRNQSDACVYQSGHFVYHINHPNSTFYCDIRNKHMAKKSEAAKKYETTEAELKQKD